MHKKQLGGGRSIKSITPTKTISCFNRSNVPTYGQYYVYSSTPKPSHLDRPKTKASVINRAASSTVGSCHARHAANIGTKGAHDWHNMMWDPSVYRGNTCHSFQEAELARFKKKCKEDEALVKKRKFPRWSLRMAGGIVRPATPTNERGDGEKIGFENMGMQTDQFLEELTQEVNQMDMSTQADEVTRKATGRILKPFAIGTSQQCQTDSSLSYPFAVRAGVIQKELCGKVMEQSLLETQEEFELETIRKEKRAYIEWRMEELFKWKRMADAARIVAEDRAMAIEHRKREEMKEEDAESRLGAALFASRCVGGIMPVTFKMLTLDGYMSETGAHDIYEMLLPWMDREVKRRYGRTQVSRNLLDDVIHHVTQSREIEIASEMWSSEITSSTAHQRQNSLEQSSPQQPGVNFYLYDDDEVFGESDPGPQKRPSKGSKQSRRESKKSN